MIIFLELGYISALIIIIIIITKIQKFYVSWYLPSTKAWDMY